jgi:hypothetical protein
MNAYMQPRPAFKAAKLPYAGLFPAATAHPQNALPKTPPSRPSTALLLNPDFNLVRKGYQIRIANGMDALKRQTARLIERMYSSRGLFPYGQGVSLDERNITVVACKDEHAVATLTLSMDMGEGLLADTLYRDEIDALRRVGGRVCEVTRFAMDPAHSSHEALAGMLQILYILARLTHRVTDVFIEVHPRHSGFYRRLLGYQVLGPERICPRVGAPAVLMHLCQRKLDELIERHAGRSDDDSRSFYRLFPTRDELIDMQRELVRGSAHGGSGTPSALATAT